MAPKTFNAAVIGYGMSAKVVFHIPLILAVPAFKLYGIVQRSPKPSDDASKDHPGTKSWRSVDEMYSDSAVDVVVVTTIPETHFDFTKRALESGKHVVVEKPFVPTSKEADELIAIAKKSGKLLTVYQNRRWDSDYLTLSSILNEGTLGDLAEFETHFDRHRPGAPPDTSREAWKGADLPGHGAAYDLGTHLIDQVYHSFGAPKRVTGFIGDQRRGKKGGSPDSCTVLMHYDGMLVTVKAGIISPEVEQLRYWVRGTKGSFKKFNLDPQEDQLKAGLRPGDAGFGVEDDKFHGTLTTVEGDKPVRRTFPTVEPATYVPFYETFGRALQGDGDVPVRPEDASAVLRIIELALMSSREGRTVEV